MGLTPPICIRKKEFSKGENKKWKDNSENKLKKFNKPQFFGSEGGKKLSAKFLFFFLFFFLLTENKNSFPGEGREGGFLIELISELSVGFCPLWPTNTVSEFSRSKRFRFSISLVIQIGIEYDTQVPAIICSLNADA